MGLFDLSYKELSWSRDHSLPYPSVISHIAYLITLHTLKHTHAKYNANAVVYLRFIYIFSHCLAFSLSLSLLTFQIIEFVWLNEEIKEFKVFDFITLSYLILWYLQVGQNFFDIT